MKYTDQKSENTAEFYDRLMVGDVKRGILGKDSRYNSVSLAQKKSVQKYFLEVVAEYINPDDRLLDFGCGPGTFSLLVSPLCKTVHSVDISKEFINTCIENIEKLNVKNVIPAVLVSDDVPFADNYFDVIMMVDVIHHLDDIEFRMKEIYRLLKPGGRLLIFEPNKLNPVLWLLHYFDPNERGLMRVGTPGSYQKLLKEHFIIEKLNFNGIVIGPSAKIYDLISRILNSKYLPFLAWLNPKLFISAKKRST